MPDPAPAARLQAALEHRGQLHTEESHRQLHQLPQPLERRGVLQRFTKKPLAALDCGSTCMPCSGKDQGCHWVTSTDSGLTCSVGHCIVTCAPWTLVTHLDHVVNAVAGEEVRLDGGKVGELGGWGLADELVGDREHLHD